MGSGGRGGAWAWALTVASALAWLLLGEQVGLASDLPARSAPAPSAQPPGGVAITLPAFDYTATLITPGGGGVLRAEETGWFRIDLLELEGRPHRRVRVGYKALVLVEGLTPSGALEVGEVAGGERRTVELPIAADRALASGTADYVIEVTAEGGAYGAPTRVSFSTRAFVPPRLEILAVDRQRQGERLLVRAQIQNLGGPARDVSARFVADDPAVTLDSTASLPLGDLASGQVREVAAAVAFTSGGVAPTEVPLWLEIRERHADLGLRERVTISLRENELLTNTATSSEP